MAHEGMVGGEDGGAGPPGNDRRAGVRARSGKAKEPWTHRFIAELALHFGDASAAARACGKSRSAAFRHRENNPDFAEAWMLVLESYRDELEACLRKRALLGDMRQRVMRNGEVEKWHEFDSSIQVFVARTQLRDRGWNVAQGDEGAGGSSREAAAALRRELDGMAASVPEKPAATVSGAA